MKYNVTWIEEKHQLIDAQDIEAAEEKAVNLMARLGRFPTVRLVSIHKLDDGSAPAPKPPTPFNRPPSGTPAGGQMRVAEPLPDVRAA